MNKNKFKLNDTKKTVSIRMELKDINKVQSAAKAEKRTFSSYVNYIVLKYLEDKNER